MDLDHSPFIALPAPARHATPSVACDRVALPNATTTELITLDSGCGVRARLLGWGATLVSLELPDEHGEIGHVLLGFPDPGSYVGPQPFFGATVGRFANRIAGANFVLDGVSHRLEPNDGPHHLHGGTDGFHHRLFAGEPFADPSQCGVLFSRVSADGESGYPGRLETQIRYALSADGALRIDYAATTDRPTVVNLTHHSYFNLRDGGAGDVLDHVLWLAADRALVMDASGIPTGAVQSVENSALDFRGGRRIGQFIHALPDRGGYDHCYLHPGGSSARLQHVATLWEPTRGRLLQVWTTQPALQLYSGNQLDGSFTGHSGVRYQRHAGVCLETQHCPDAPNQPRLGSARLDPGQQYAHSVVYRFGLREKTAG